MENYIQKLQGIHLAQRTGLKIIHHYLIHQIQHLKNLHLVKLYSYRRYWVIMRDPRGKEVEEKEAKVEI